MQNRRNHTMIRTTTCEHCKSSVRTPIREVIGILPREGCRQPAGLVQWGRAASLRSAALWALRTIRRA
eukprot:3352149-Pyramimonas_sp.AAC.2